MYELAALADEDGVDGLEEVVTCRGVSLGAGYLVMIWWAIMEAEGLRQGIEGLVLSVS